MDFDPHFSDHLPPRTPVVLLVLIEVVRQRWSVAAFNESGGLLPLVQSEDGDLARYLIPPFEEQLSFLRHRLCGVLQRGNDRLYARNMKAAEIVFICDRPFGTTGEVLTQALADHFAEWLTRPPVVFFVIEPRTVPKAKLRLLAGELTLLSAESLETHVSELVQTARDGGRWELIPRKS